ncbi:hypothetical protein GOV08_01370 [Candidatus Woesearchaeota archaeon]|nr:hypothetical protein [Candidatus Woesearchaeota archaeon]
MYIFTNTLGSFVIDEKFKIVEKTNDDEKLLKKYKDAKKPTNPKVINHVLKLFKDDAKKFYEVNISNTKKLISKSVKDDNLIISAIKTIEDLDVTANSLAKRLRDWYSYYLPEAENDIYDNEAFSRVVLEKNKDVLKKELKIEDSMGADLKKSDVDSMLSLAKLIQEIFSQRKQTEEYVEKVMKRSCPNFLAIVGPNIGAKLIAKAGSIKKMVFMPASTIQLLGAEEALFRHLKTGAKPPKYGILLQHPLVSKAKKKDRGKAAKTIADKLSIAIKVDYFKGDFIGDKLRKDIEKKIG